MEFSGSGAGIMLALAAVLWLLYLLPSWFKRREYLATERNAIRLQQSLRVLAQTAEVPEVVRVESSARSVAQQERIRRDLEKRRRAQERRAAAEARSRSAAAARATRSFAIPEPVAPVAPAVPARVGSAPVPAVPAARVARLRRTRMLATLMLAAALGSGLVLGGVIATSGASLLASAGIGTSGVLGITAIAVLNRLAAVSRSLAPAAPQRRTAQAFADLAPLEPEVREWTPVPLPKPLYMSKPLVDPPVMADPREDERITAAVDAGEVTQLAPASRFAAMGRIELASGPAPDLDAALRRRRAAG
jgi:hypothetical protein